MTTRFNGTDFTTVEISRFAPAFSGAQSRREAAFDKPTSLIARRASRINRRANRAI